MYSGGAAGFVDWFDEQCLSPSSRSLKEFFARSPSRWQHRYRSFVSPEGVVPTRFLAALDQQQIAWMSEARPGETPGGACITSYRTSEADIR
jgi:hypothetical protein